MVIPPYGHYTIYCQNSKFIFAQFLSVLAIVSNNITYRGYKASGCDLIVHQNLLEHLGMDTRIQRIAISAGSQGGQELKTGLQEMLGGREDITERPLSPQQSWGE